ncbi:hypothetical protein C1H46_023841 [Malus baccata]|uniref:Uncharacterized protein n=1 Tax=Malus baccata TaxID=106549 RepID=A0A540LW19_MALBA|nr:hypothetical protein C1H46_023841 [Malus baccata]
MDFGGKTQVMDFGGDTQVMDFSGDTQAMDFGGETQVFDEENIRHTPCEKSVNGLMEQANYSVNKQQMQGSMFVATLVVEGFPELKPGNWMKEGTITIQRHNRKQRTVKHGKFFKGKDDFPHSSLPLPLSSFSFLPLQSVIDTARSLRQEWEVPDGSRGCLNAAAHNPLMIGIIVVYG